MCKMKKYFIVSNSGILYQRYFENDDKACLYVKKYFYEFLTSILCSDHINLYNSEKECLIEISPVSGDIVKDWRFER